MSFVTEPEELQAARDIALAVNAQVQGAGSIGVALESLRLLLTFYLCVCVEQGLLDQADAEGVVDDFHQFSLAVLRDDFKPAKAVH